MKLLIVFSDIFTFINPKETIRVRSSKVGGGNTTYYQTTILSMTVFSLYKANHFHGFKKRAFKA